jgi:NitT/TauT family transport system substrate-binding protein
MMTGSSGHAAAWLAAMLVLTCTAQAETAKWRHAVLEPKSDSGIILMAAKRGFMEKFGLDVEIIGLKNELLAQRAAVAGEIDSFEGSPPYAAIATGSKLKVVGCYWTALPYHVFAKESVKTIQDMRGKTIATAAPGSAPDMVAHAILEYHKVPAGEVTFANVGGDADRYRAVTQGIVDATVVSGEYTPIAARDKLHSIATAHEALPNYDRLCISMNENSLTKRRADAVKFLAGEMSGLRYALSHRDETIALAREVTGQKPDDPRPGWVFDDALREKAVDPDVPISTERLKGMQDLMLRSGALNKSAPVDQMVDLKLREEAQALLKR